MSFVALMSKPLFAKVLAALFSTSSAQALRSTTPELLAAMLLVIGVKDGLEGIDIITIDGLLNVVSLSKIGRS